MTIWKCQSCGAKGPIDSSEVAIVGRAPYHSECRDKPARGLMSYVGEYSPAAVAAMKRDAQEAPRTSRYYGAVSAQRRLRIANVAVEGFNRPFERLLTDRKVDA